MQQRSDPSRLYSKNFYIFLPMEEVYPAEQSLAESLQNYAVSVCVREILFERLLAASTHTKHTPEKTINT